LWRVYPLPLVSLSLEQSYAFKNAILELFGGNAMHHESHERSSDDDGGSSVV
jgi:hypothetical protein